MGYATVALLLAAFAQDRSEAEQLFRKMEETVAGTKALQTAVVITITGKKDGKFEGALALAKGNKARMNLKGAMAEKTLDLSMVSDGTRMKVKDPGGKQAEQNTPKKLNEVLAGALNRAGLFATLMMSRRSDQDEPNVEDLFRVSGFKFGKKDKVGDRAAQVVEYQFAFPDSPTFQAAVWIDSQTHLPLKRLLTASKGDERLTITETYSGLRIDAALDDKTFALPK
jgi:outer membrane lipoprotein-sorting protein